MSELERLKRLRMDQVQQNLQTPEAQKTVDRVQQVAQKNWNTRREQRIEQIRADSWDNAVNMTLDSPAGLEAYIWNNYSGKERDDMYSNLYAAYDTPGSQFYDAYHKKVTNQKYLNDLASYGVQVPEVVTSDWLNQMSAQYRGDFKYSDTSGNPNSPGKKATTEQKIAYAIWQLQSDEDTTEKAEAEWADMKSKIQYWTNKGLSDNEIRAKIDMKKYPTLAKMDESRTAGNYVPMNRVIGYSKDAINGVIWKARNGQDDMDDFSAAVHYNLKHGRGDRSTTRSIAQRTVGTSEYNPYIGGSNDDEARMTTGVDRWDNEWLKVHQQEMYEAGQGDLWRQMDNDLRNYETAKKQYDILSKWVSDYDYSFEAGSYEEVLKRLSADLDDRLTNESGLYFDDPLLDGAGKLKALTDMDEGRRTGKPVSLSDELNYRKEDVLAEMMQRYLLQHNQKITASEPKSTTPPQTTEPGTMDPASEQALRMAMGENPKSSSPRIVNGEVQGPDVSPVELREVQGPDVPPVEAPEPKIHWTDKTKDRVESYQTDHPSNGTFNNQYMVPMFNMDGRSGSLRYNPQMASGAVSDSGMKLPEQQYINAQTGKTYTRSELETALTNSFMGVASDEENEAVGMLVKSVPWAFRTEKKVSAWGSAMFTFEGNGDMIFDAIRASECGYASAKDQAQMVLAFYDDAAAAAANHQNIATYYKEHPETFSDVQSIMDKIYEHRDEQLAEDAAREQQTKVDNLASAKTIINKLGTGEEISVEDQNFLASITPNGTDEEKDAYMGKRSPNFQYLAFIDYEGQLLDVQNRWYEAQREASTEINVDQFALDTKMDGITELMEQGIIYDAKLAESAGMTLEEYYQATGSSLNVEDRFKQAQAAWDAREAPENRTDEQNTGIGLLGVIWNGAKMGTIDTAAGYVGFAADIASMAGTDTHAGTKEKWLEYTYGNDISGVVEARSSYRTGLLAYADEIQEAYPEKAEMIRTMIQDATMNGEDIFNVNFDVDLDKIERAYQDLQKINETTQEYIDTHATDLEKSGTRQLRSAVSSTERMLISGTLGRLGAPAWLAGMVAFTPGTFDSTYRAEIAANGGDQTSAAVYAGISALIDTFTEQAFMSKWYNFGGEAAQSWLMGIQKSQLAKVGPAGTAGNLAHRAAAYFLGWAATQSSEVMQELGQDGISTVWDFIYHKRDVNWLKDQFDFVNNPEARQNLVDTVMSTLMSVTMSYNMQQTFGRKGYTITGDGATAFSSYDTIQKNIQLGEMYRQHEAEQKANEEVLAQDMSGVTVEEEAPTLGEVLGQDNPVWQDPNFTGQSPTEQAPVERPALAPTQNVPTPVQTTPAQPAAPAAPLPAFAQEANDTLNDLSGAIDQRSKALDILEDTTKEIEERGEEALNDPVVQEGLKIAADTVKDGQNRGIGQGLEVSDSAANNPSDGNVVRSIESITAELKGQLGALTIQHNDTVRDLTLKLALHAMYSNPVIREEMIRQNAERRTGEAIAAGELTNDPATKAAVDATETAKAELTAAQEEERQAETEAQTAQQTLENIAANRGQEGWSPKQEVSAAKNADSAKKNLENAKKKTRAARKKHDTAKEASNKALDAKKEAIESREKEVATAQFEQEAETLLTNLDDVDEPMVPSAPPENAPTAQTVRTAEEEATLETEANAELERVESLTPEQNAAEIQELGAVTEETTEAPAPVQTVQSQVGNRLRTEVVNEKGRPILTKAQIESIEKALNTSPELNAYFEGLSVEDLAQFVTDYKGRTKRSTPASFMRNWMEQKQNPTTEETVEEAPATEEDIDTEVDSEEDKAERTETNAFDELTRNFSPELKDTLANDEKAQQLIEKINTQRKTFFEAADTYVTSQGDEMYNARATMDNAKNTEEALKNQFARLANSVQSRMETDQRQASRKDLDRSEERHAEIKALVDGVQKRIQKIVDQYKNSLAANSQPMKRKPTRELMNDLRTILDYGLGRIENDLNGIGDISEQIKELTPAFDAINQLATLAGDKALPGSIAGLNGKLRRAINGMAKARQEVKEASEAANKAVEGSPELEAANNKVAEAGQAYQNAFTAVKDLRNKMMNYANELDGMLDKYDKKYPPKPVQLRVESESVSADEAHFRNRDNNGNNGLPPANSDGDVSQNPPGETLIPGLNIVPDDQIPSTNVAPDDNAPSTNVEQDNGKGKRQFANETAQDSWLPDWVQEELRTNPELSDYDVDSNRAQMARAAQQINSYGPEAVFNDLYEKFKDGKGHFNKDDQATAVMLMMYATHEGDNELLLSTTGMYDIMGTEAGQALQARKIFQKLTPTGAKMNTARQGYRWNQQAREQNPNKYNRARSDAARIVEYLKGLPSGGETNSNNKWGVELNPYQQELIALYKLENVNRPGVNYNRASIKQRMLEAIIATPNVYNATNEGLTLVDRLEMLDKGIPVVTNADLDYIGTQMGVFMGEGSFGGKEEAHIALARAYEASANIKPSGFGDKLRTFRYTNMLLSVPTTLRNIMGNFTQNAVNDLSHGVARGLDAGVSLITGKRTVGGLTAEQRINGWKSFVHELSNTYTDYFVDRAVAPQVEASQVAGEALDPANRFNTNSRNRTYQSGVLEARTTLENFLMSMGDRPVWAKHFRNSLDEQMNVAGNVVATQEQIEQAIADANYSTFTEDNRLVDAIQAFKQKLGPYGGIVDWIMPFTGVPSNILKRMYQYSPLSLVSTGIKHGIAYQKGTFDQRSFVTEAARGLTGTGMTLLGMMFANMGMIRFGTSDEDDDKKRGLRNANGEQYSSYIYNPFTNDYVSLSTFNPAVSPILLGTVIHDIFKNDPDVFNVVTGALAAEIDSIIDASYLSGLQNVMTSYQNGGIGEAAIAAASSGISSFTPAVGAQLASALDPYVRDTNDKSSIMKAINSGVINRIPVLRQMLLPEKVDVTGQAVENYKKGLENLINPLTVSKARDDEAINELLRLAEATGDSSFLPSDPLYGKRNTLSGVERPLTNKEKELNKKLRGTLAFDGGETKDKNGNPVQVTGIRKLMASPAYAELSDADKAKEIKAIVQAANAAAIRDAKDTIGAVQKVEEEPEDNNERKTIGARPGILDQITVSPILDLAYQTTLDGRFYPPLRGESFTYKNQTYPIDDEFYGYYVDFINAKLTNGEALDRLDLETKAKFLSDVWGDAYNYAKNTYRAKHPRQAE